MGLSELQETRELIFDKIQKKLTFFDEGKRYYSCGELGIIHIFWNKNRWDKEWIDMEDIEVYDWKKVV